MKKRLFSILFFMLFCLMTKAQFYTMGSDPFRTKWMKAETEHYELIFPTFADSLAKVYAGELEKFYPYESLSSGYAPTEFLKKKLPVILHPYSATANGAIIWAPKRMSLLTVPAADFTSSLAWETNLAVHESRHLSQMMMGYNRWLNPLRYAFGDGAASVASALYEASYFMEGDAVLAETGLTKAGRGRSWDFQGYSMMAWDKGDRRNFTQWLYGSNRRFSPDQYTFGYLAIGSVRAMYNEPYFAKTYLRTAENPLHYDTSNRTFGAITGKSYYKKPLWNEIVDRNVAEFNSQAEKRGPFAKADTLMPAWKNQYLKYSLLSNSVMTRGGRIIAVRLSAGKAYELVEIDPKTRVTIVLARFSATASRIVYDPALERIYWSEHTPTSWELKEDSRIYYMDLNTFIPTDRALTRRGQIIINPAIFDDCIGAIRYNHDGSADIVRINSYGDIFEKFPCPAGVQPIETAMHQGTIHFVGLSAQGYAIYAFKDGWVRLTAPVQSKISNFNACDDHLTFASDRGGVEELYAFYPESGSFELLTNQKYGSTSFMQSGKYIYSFAPDLKGHCLIRTEPLHWKVDFENEGASWWIADAMTAQEDSLAIAAGLAPASTIYTERIDAGLSEAKPYHRMANPGKIHTWVPLYVPFDPDDDYADILTQSSIGATAFFQNELGTSAGLLGYSFARDPYDSGKWRHGAHLFWKGTGTIPHITAKLDINDRDRRNIYSFKASGMHQGHKATLTGISQERINAPSVQGSVKLSLPIVAGHSGQYHRITPRASLSFSNDHLENRDAAGYVFSEDPENPGSYSISLPEGTTYKPAGKPYSLYASANYSISYSLSTYKPAASVFATETMYAELGYSHILGADRMFSPLAYFSCGVTIPGLLPCTAWKFTVLTQKPVDKTSLALGPVINILPRGFTAATSSGFYAVDGLSFRYTIEYAIPINLNGFALGDSFYTNRINVIPFFDTAFNGKSGRLHSEGFTLSLDIQRFLIFAGNFSFGVQCAWNYGDLDRYGFPDRQSVFTASPVFSASF